MRVIYFLFLLVFTGAAALLAYENQQEITMNFFGNTIVMSIPILVAVTYMAGMLSGWTVVGMLRRSLSQVLSKPLPGEYASAR